MRDEKAKPNSSFIPHPSNTPLKAQVVVEKRGKKMNDEHINEKDFKKYGESELPPREFEVQHIRPVNRTASPPELWAFWKRG